MHLNCFFLLFLNINSDHGAASGVGQCALPRGRPPRKRRASLALEAESDLNGRFAVSAFKSQRASRSDTARKAKGWAKIRHEKPKDVVRREMREARALVVREGCARYVDAAIARLCLCLMDRDKLIDLLLRHPSETADAQPS